MSEPNLPSAIEASAGQLCRQAGFGVVQTIEPLPGGRNNRVYRVQGSLAAGILKHYHQPPGAQADRFASEMAWYAFCERHAVRHMPRRLAVDEETRCALLEEIQGKKLVAGEANAGHVQQAISFFTEVNASRAQARPEEIPFAAEACFSLAEHCQRIERRIERLASLSADDDLSTALKSWLAGDVRPVWDAVIAGMHGRFRTDERQAALPCAERCLSPSDFGFHNALEDADGQLWFLDFEYAGWDDPAKMMCDFYWQVDVPAPRSTLPLWNAALAPWGAEVHRRVQALFPLFGLKWSTIVLNEFLRDGADRREFAGHPPSVDRRRRQFAQAQQLLADVRTMIETH